MPMNMWDRQWTQVSSILPALVTQIALDPRNLPQSWKQFRMRVRCHMFIACVCGWLQENPKPQTQPRKDVQIALPH